MEKQNRRVWGFVNPDIVPVDQDQWERLKSEISSIQPVVDTSANVKWGIIGFSGSLIISNVFYLLSASPNYTVIFVSAALLIGLLISAWAFDKMHKTAKNAQELSVEQCRNTVIAVEKRLRAEEPELISALFAENEVPDNTREVIVPDKFTDEPKTAISPSPKDILSKLKKTTKLGG